MNVNASSAHDRARRFTVLHVFSPGEVGGLERVVQTLAGGQQRRGHEVHVAAIVDYPDHPALMPLIDAGVHVLPLVIPPRLYMRERRLVARLCRDVRPDVVHTHGYRADVVNGGVARRLGIPTATTVHGFTGGGRKNRMYEWMQRTAFRRFDAVVAVSRPLHEQLTRSGLRRDRVHLLRNAWGNGGHALDRARAREALDLPADGFRVGWAGRLTREKAPDVFVDAMSHVDAPIHASILGDGREREALQARAKALGAASRIDWHGTVPDAGQLFRAFDVFVLSSRTEGTPMALFEAMAAAVPVIATSVGGVPDVVSAEEALLVPSEDPAALARAIHQVMKDPDAATARAAAARRRLNAEFGAESWLDGYDAVYHNLCS